MIGRALLVFFLMGSTFVSATSRDWHHSVLGYVTRCFEVRNVQARCEDFTESGEKLRREELQIDGIDRMNQRFGYSYERAIEGSLCQEQLTKIRKLMAKADQVCISGTDEMRFETGETLAKWAGLETRFGEIVR